MSTESSHVRPRQPRSRLRRPVGTAATAALAALALAGCTVGGPRQVDASMPASDGTTASALATRGPLETTATNLTIPVYWLGHSNSDVFLYREFLPAPAKSDPIVAALAAMTSQRPLDPDYFTVWKKPSRLGASISAHNVITVDISADAFSPNVDEGIAQRSISQLVYTATAAASMAGLIDPSQKLEVSILVDGHTGYNAFGHVPLTKPLTRDTGFVAPIWIVDPANGATFGSGSVKVTGRGTSGTGSVDWQLRQVSGDTTGAVVRSGSAPVSGGPNQLGGFSFTLSLPAGTYELRVFTAKAGDPAQQPGLDSKVFTLK